MKRAIAFAFFFFLLSCAAADRLSPSYCPQVMSGEQLASCQQIPSYLPENEQKQVVLALLYDYEGFPNYAFMKEWNTDPEYYDAPEGATKKSSYNYFGSGGFSVIQNAWMEIVAVNPSLEQDGVMYSPGTGEVQSEYNYTIHVPPFMPGRHVCPYLFTYAVDPATAYQKVTMNNVTLSQGNPLGQRLVEYSTDRDMTFKSTLTVSTTVHEHAYRERLRCFSCGENTCCVWVCDDLGITDYPVSVTTDDTEKREYHDYSYFVNYARDGTSKIIVDLFSTGPLNSYHIYFNGAEFESKRYNYPVGFSQTPYDVLHAKASPYEMTEGHNMHVDENTSIISLAEAEELIRKIGPNEQSREFVRLVEETNAEVYYSRFILSFDPSRLANLERCEMHIWSHFQKIELNDLCSKNILPPTRIELDVNSSYPKGEEITAEFTVSSNERYFDGVMEVEFQNETFEVPFRQGKGSVSFQAEEGGIIALNFASDLKHASQYVNKRIYVQNEDVMRGLFDLALYFAGWIFMFILIKKSLKKWFP